ncbi:MAG: response regulator transcription factor [Acidobacteria bacterium]|nr:response regulator transcription factor [Acidobacteriota bacterium]
MPAPTKPARILVADNEEPVRNYLKTVLTRHKFEVLLAANGDDALDVAVDHTPDLVILERLLPRLNGLEVCQQLRLWLAAPILILSALGDEAGKIAALDLGADDYITKPFAAGELLARIRALLRRAAAAVTRPEPVVLRGDLKIDLARRRILRGKAEIHLTRTEFDILAYLVQNADCVVSCKTILQKVWAPEYGDDTQTLRVHVGHLRRKIEPDLPHPRFILTEQGIGYRFSTS